MNQTKTLYALYNTETCENIATSMEYGDDNATMWALRTLGAMKRQGTAPEHATLYALKQHNKKYIVQTFKRS